MGLPSTRGLPAPWQALRRYLALACSCSIQCGASLSTRGSGLGVQRASEVTPENQAKAEIATRRASFRNGSDLATKKKTAQGMLVAARRSWVLRGVYKGVAEEAHGVAPLALPSLPHWEQCLRVRLAVVHVKKELLIKR